MIDLTGKRVAVIGLDPSGIAAYELLLSAGAKPFLLADEGQTSSQKQTADLHQGSAVLGSAKELAKPLDFAVHSAAVSRGSKLIQTCLKRDVPVISDLELAARHFYCLNVAVTGTNGKSTTAELLSHMFEQSHRKIVRAGGSGAAIASIASKTRELDFAVLDVNSFQLESIEHFRPAVGVLLNLKPDHMDRYEKLSSYVQAVGSMFKNQQFFDWAIIQSEALAHLRELGVPVPSKIITFSSQNRRADIYLDRGLLISSIENWTGPLFNMDQCSLKGPHNAENVMAALAAGHVLRLPLEEMIAAVKRYRPGPHRLETVTEFNGITFVNNSKAMNVDAVQQSIEALPAARGSEPNVWLIAGGKDKGLDYHDLGPLLARRVKGAFLLGETREKLRAAWSLFTPCVVVASLLEAVSKAVECATDGDFVLLSPACSSLDMFQSYQHRGETFRQAVEHLVNVKRSGAERQFSSVTRTPVCVAA